MEKSKSQRVYKIIMLVVLTIVITFLGTSIFMYKIFESQYYCSASESSSSNSSNSGNLSATLSEFKSILEQKYIGNLDENKMIQGAIKGYVAGLGDQYTEYLTTDEMKSLTEETNSKYVGIGVYVGNNTETNTILVVGVMNGSPALEVGMKAGDTIEKVNGISYTGEQLTEATSVLKGEENTQVNVTVLRDGKEMNFDITRKTITVEHVASKTLDDNIGYIQINSFDDGVASKFEEELKSLQKSNIKGLIIDLRSNGGGVVQEATDIAKLFTKNGDSVLITTDKNGKEELTKATQDPIVTNIPVIVLVNEGTASASEILAGALKDNYGAKIVGKNTYGKGVIQTVYKLSDGSGLKITTNEYYTPNRTKINKVGIKPDVEIDLTKDSSGNYETAESTDAQLKKAIETVKANEK